MTANEIAKTFEDCAIDHEPEGWPAVQQKELSEAAAMLRKQAEAIKTLRDALVDIDNCYLNPKTRRRVIVGIAQAALASTEEMK